MLESVGYNAEIPCKLNIFHLNIENKCGLRKINIIFFKDFFKVF